MDTVESVLTRMTPLAPRDVAGSLILVVEDHDILRDGLQIVLETEGYQVVTACNGSQALARLHNYHPDLILSDITMPEMDGFALYDAVRARYEWVTIPFIFLTARGGTDAVMDGHKMGVDDYLVKPVDRRELLTAVQARLERSRQLMLVELEQSYEATLVMLSNAIEVRDKYTRGHVERVRDLVTRVAEILGLNEAQIRPLRFGAILHDIGKIYTPESILSKPGTLTAEEWDEMKRHPINGAELLKPIPYLAGAIPIIRSHHERWDGLGYPDGMAGNDIPLGARIVSVVDCFDAMTTDRSYHAASPQQEALDEIRRSTGTRYDPMVVQAFLAFVAQ